MGCFPQKPWHLEYCLVERPGGAAIAAYCFIAAYCCILLGNIRNSFGHFRRNCTGCVRSNGARADHQLDLYVEFRRHTPSIMSSTMIQYRHRVGTVESFVAPCSDSQAMPVELILEDGLAGELFQVC